MKQLQYDDICMLIGRITLEYEGKLKNIFDEFLILKKENEDLKSGPSNNQENSK